LLALPCMADEADEGEGEELVVEARRPRKTASERVLDADRVQAFPARSSDELLRAMPGLHQSAHGGHGKAYQYFVRGFDAVHGADLAVSLEGIPLNEPSNVHGHGYLDLHFLPTALVHTVALHKGASRAEVGDFGVAASADFHLGLTEPGLRILAGGGTDRSGDLLLTWRPPKGESGDFLLAQADAGLGVADHRAWEQLNLGAGLEHWFGRTRARAFALGYRGRFDSPGVIREDDLLAGELDFYDAYPEAGGGLSSRLLVGAELARPSARHGCGLLAWGQLRQLELSRNFTGYTREPEHGDGLLQGQQGAAFGLRVRRWEDLRLRGGWHRLAGGVDLRADLLDQWERGVELDGAVWEERIDAGVGQGSAGAWASVELHPWSWLELEPGQRAELLGVRLLRRLDDEGLIVAAPEPALSWAPVLAPKARAVLLAEQPVSFFFSYGRGYRSPEARGIEDGDRAPVSTADTEELGLRWEPTPGLELTLVGFHTAISNELIFDHAAARFLSSGATRRQGAELLAGLEPSPWLRSELELVFTDGRYLATGESLPFAPRWLASAGLYSHGEGGRGDLRWNGGLRGWFLGPRPLPEGFYSQPAFVLDATARAEWRRWLLELEVDNLLGTHWRDGEFVYPSCFDPARGCSELPALHITAGEPFALRIGLGRRFG
jgi:iron complex outermembrane receptor protein